MVRKSTVQNGVVQNPILFNPTLEYDSLPDATYSGLGFHSCDCAGPSSINEDKEISYVMYPNPVISGKNVMINSSFPVKHIAVSNTLGEKVVFDSVIKTTDLAKGVYIVSIEFENGFLSEQNLIID